MNKVQDIQTGTLESLCPIAGSMGEWLVVIDGRNYLTWPDAMNDTHDDRRCRRFSGGKSVRFRPDGSAFSIPVGRRAGHPDAPMTVQLLDMEE
ncbi:MAG: hypothetical protein H6981_08840 [Gammaproteobacteria bacterium]|nr:hypothetical protein [Gammaproteobacteria bacterium]MCP5136894.1 hypothetical protein [Gammaproteobacteria bacterium]